MVPRLFSCVYFGEVFLGGFYFVCVGRGLFVSLFLHCIFQEFLPFLKVEPCLFFCQLCCILCQVLLFSPLIRPIVKLSAGAQVGTLSVSAQGASAALQKAAGLQGTGSGRGRAIVKKTELKKQTFGFSSQVDYCGVVVCKSRIWIFLPFQTLKLL